MSQHLYEWYDQSVRQHGAEMGKASACGAIVFQLGVLAGLGVDPEDIRDFVERSLSDTLVLLQRVSPSSTLGENLDAMFARPVLTALDGGKISGDSE